MNKLMHGTCRPPLGLDHVVANMYFIPTATWNPHPQITVSFHIWKPLVSTPLGNIVRGGPFVGVACWYLFLTASALVDIDFNLGSLNTPMEAGSPLRPRPNQVQVQAMPNGYQGSEGEVTEERPSTMSLPILIAMRPSHYLIRGVTWLAVPARS